MRSWLAVTIVLTTFPAFAGEPSPANLELSCSGVFASDSSIEAILETFGAANIRHDTMPGVDGTPQPITLLYPDDPTRRLEITWLDAKARRQPISLVARGKENQWHYGDVKPGSTLAEVEAANGAGVTFTGFGWEYGGYVLRFNKGVFEGMPNGCRLSLRLKPAETAKLPEKLRGDSVEIQSSDKSLAKLKITVDEIGLSVAAGSQ